MTTLLRSVSPELVLVDPELARRLRALDERGAVEKEDDGMYDVNGVNGNGTGQVAAPASAPPPAAAPGPDARPSLEATLLDGGFIDAAQFGEVMREHAATGQSVEGIVRQRGFVRPEVLDRLLGRLAQQSQVAPPETPAAPAGVHAPIELVPTAFAAPDAAQPPAPVAAPMPAVVDPAPVAMPEPVPMAEPVAMPEPEPVAAAEPAAPPLPDAAPLAAVPTPYEAPAAMPAPEPVPTLQVVPEPVEHLPAPTRSVVFDVLVRLTDGHELHAASHGTLDDARAAARALTESGEWLDVGDALVQRPAVSAVEVRPRLAREG